MMASNDKQPDPGSHPGTGSQPTIGSQSQPPIDAETFRKLLSDNSAQKIDWEQVRSTIPEVRMIDVSQRVEELQKYLRENTYPTQRKNIMAAIEMYNRKELPKPNTRSVTLQGGELAKDTIESFLSTEPVWLEVSLREWARMYLIYAIGL
jgi:hypothetical protein